MIPGNTLSMRFALTTKPCVWAWCEHSLVPWASFQGWPQSCPWAGTGSPEGWSGAYGTPRSSPSPGADVNCHGQKVAHPAGEKKEEKGMKIGGDKINLKRGKCVRTKHAWGSIFKEAKPQSENRWKWLTTSRAKRITPQLHTSALRPSYFSPCQ